MTLHPIPLHFLIYEKNFVFFFISVQYIRDKICEWCWKERQNLHWSGRYVHYLHWQIYQGETLYILAWHDFLWGSLDNRKCQSIVDEGKKVQHGEIIGYLGQRSSLPFLQIGGGGGVFGGEVIVLPSRLPSLSCFPCKMCNDDPRLVFFKKFLHEVLQGFPVWRWGSGKPASFSHPWNIWLFFHCVWIMLWTVYFAFVYKKHLVLYILYFYTKAEFLDEIKTKVLVAIQQWPRAF
jgi:hypothetical protein